MDRRVKHHFLTRESDGGNKLNAFMMEQGAVACTVSPYLAWR